jgi:hypothetical protein
MIKRHDSAKDFNLLSSSRKNHNILAGDRWSAEVNQMRICAAALVLGIAAAGVAGRSEGQTVSGRTLEELKAEALARADRNAYPLIGLKPGEVREALERLTSLDRDEWAASWSRIGDRYLAKGSAEVATAPKQADADFLQAWLYYSFARWPVPNSPGKQRAYEKALEAVMSNISPTRSCSILRWRSSGCRSRARRSSATCECQRARAPRPWW